MRARILLVTSFMLAAALLLPTAAAQPAPKINVIVKWAMDHDHQLDDDGQDDMGIIVEVSGQDFVCAQPLKGKVEVRIETSFAKWAGASMVPKLVPTDPKAFYTFDAGKPGLGATPVPASPASNDEAKLNLKWDLETAPRTKAEQEYQVKGYWVGQEGGPCTSATPTINNPPSNVMKVSLADRPETVNATGNEVVCAENPFAPGCPGATQTGQANEGGDAPGPDLVVILLGLVGLVGVWRRRQN